MKSRIQKIGEGLAVLLPQSISNQSGLTADTEVEVTLENGAVIARATAKPRHKLVDLVAKITDENRHSDTDTGPMVGRAW